MESRTEKLINIRPLIGANVNGLSLEIEHFQNKTIRPILKFQNDLLIKVLKQYFLKHKNGFYSLNLEKRLAYIDHAILKDIKFRNALKGMIIGHFTIEEYEQYLIHSSALNKRMMALLVQRYQDQIQVFEIP